MNKYQEALNVLYENVDYNDYSNQTIDRTNKAFDTIQELVDKSKPKKAIRKKLEDPTENRKGSLVNLVGNRYYKCPNCESYLGAFIDDYCKYCGQALVRSKEDE